MSRYYENDGDGHSRRSSSHNRRPSYDADNETDNAPYMTGAGGASTATAARSSNPDFSHQGYTNNNASSRALQVPSVSGYRPHSQPPLSTSGSLRSSDRRRDDDYDYDDDYDSREVRSTSSRDRDRDRERDRSDGSRSPLAKTKHALDNTFSTSTSGISAGVLGAIVGGLAAREATQAAARAHEKKHGSGSHSRRSSHSGGGVFDPESDRTKLLSTIVGAAVGGLGANALEKHVERRRRHKKDRDGARDNDGSDSDRSSRSSRSNRRRERRSSSSHSRDSRDSSRHRYPRDQNRDTRRRSERSLVISRSPSPSPDRGNKNYSYSNSHGRGQDYARESDRPRHGNGGSGGTADAYYSQNQSRRSEVDYR